MFSSEAQELLNNLVCHLDYRTQLLKVLAIFFSKTWAPLAMLNLESKITCLGRYGQLDRCKVLRVGVGLALAIQRIQIRMIDTILRQVTVLIVYREVWILRIVDLMSLSRYAENDK